MKDKRKEIESLLTVDEMATESLPPELYGQWCEVIVALSKTRELVLTGGSDNEM